MAKLQENGQLFKKNWVIDNYFNKGKTRPEAVDGLISEFGCSKSYARTIVYNLLSHLEWDKAPYPKDRKKRRKKDSDIPDRVKKFKTEKPEISSDGPLKDGFDF